MKKLLKICIIILLLLTANYCKAQNWCVLPITPNGYVESLKTYHNKLFVGGYFSYCGSLHTPSIATWNGSNWSSLGQCFSLNSIYPKSMEIIDDKLYLTPEVRDYIRKWNDTSFVTINNIYPDGGTTAIKYLNDIYIAGNFQKMSNNLVVNRIARLHNGNWQSVGGGVTLALPFINCMAFYKNELYVGGLFGKAGNVYTNSIARWNGSRWADVGGGFISAIISAMEVDTINDFLYVSGGFSTAGVNPSVPALLIARWDGHQWESIGNIVDNDIFCLKFYHHELYAGWPQETFGLNDTPLGRFDGEQWHYYTSFNDNIMVMEVYKDTLYIGGDFTQVGSNSTSYLVGLYEPPPTHCNWLISRIYANTDTLTIGDTIHFENNNKYATSWTWNFGDGGLDSVQKPNYIYQNSGVYTASVIVHQENCYDTAYFTVNVLQVDAVNNTKQKEYMLGNNIPNPFTNSTIIPYQIPVGKQGLIIITDTNGKEIARYTLKESKGNLEVSTQAWQAGVYNYSLVVNGKKLESKQMVVGR